MKNSDKCEDVVLPTTKCYLNQGGKSCWVGMKMLPGLGDFQNFEQGFGFASKEAISEAREFSKTRQEGFRQGCDTGVVLITEQNQTGHDCRWNEHQTLGNVFCSYLERNEGS